MLILQNNEARPWKRKCRSRGKDINQVNEVGRKTEMNFDSKPEYPMQRMCEDQEAPVLCMPNGQKQLPQAMNMGNTMDENNQEGMNNVSNSQHEQSTLESSLGNWTESFMDQLPDDAPKFANHSNLSTINHMMKVETPHQVLLLTTPTHMEKEDWPGPSPTRLAEPPDPQTAVHHDVKIRKIDNRTMVYIETEGMFPIVQPHQVPNMNLWFLCSFGPWLSVLFVN